jgi:hypothetical protein
MFENFARSEIKTSGARIVTSMAATARRCC